MTSRTPRSSWFRESFNDDYRRLYAARDQSQADAEVACVVDALQIGPQDQVLDLCCGFGRHLRSLGRRGVPAVGLDLSLLLLHDAATPHESDGAAPRKRLRVVRGDMRQLPFAGGTRGFSVVVNFFTSFGYFESDADHVRVVRELARVLRPQGRFSMDLMNPGPTVRNLLPTTERRVGELRVVESRRYDAQRCRIEKRTQVVSSSPGESREYFESVRLFKRNEITLLLDTAGLQVDRVLGDFSGLPFSAESSRMILLGSKGSCE